jgi:HEAT repeat protein
MRPLVDALGSPSWSVRAKAVDALQALGDVAVPSLVAGTTHPDARVRAESVALMDHLADARCLDPLVAALHDRSAHVRRLAVHAIGCQRCKIAPLALDIVGLLVERALEDPSPRVRRVAVHQLGLQPADQRAILALETVLHGATDEALRSRAEFALAQQRG